MTSELNGWISAEDPNQNGRRQSMNENDKSLPDLLAEMLATMTARAIRAEQERDKELKNAIEWYERWKAKNAEAEKLKADLAAAMLKINQ